jgi:acetyltransferase-like isoleucine patch superfamily enzyme
MGKLVERLVRRWRVFWLWHAGFGFWGRIGSRLASIGFRPFRNEYALARMARKGFISPTAQIIDVDLRLGHWTYIGERAVIARWRGRGFVELADLVQINRDCLLEIGDGGSITIGAQTGIQVGCILNAVVEPIIIGRRAQIAAYCAFHSFDHGTEAGREIFGQPLTSRGPIVIGDDAWLGCGVKVMSGVTIGHGAVIGAGSVVTRDIPDNAIAVGVPARVVKFREHARATTEADEGEPVGATSHTN